MAEDSPIVAHYKLRNNLHSLFLILSMAILLGAIGWLMAEHQGVALLLLAGLILFISFCRFSPQYMLNRYQASPVDANSHPELIQLVSRLSRSAGLVETPLLFCSQQNNINAFTMKINNQYVIVISQALVEKLKQNEVLAVLAHEISHIYHDDINVMLIADRLSQFTQCLTMIGLVMLALTPMMSLQDITIPWNIIISLLLGHYITALLQLSLSRTREFYADIIAVQLTHDVTAMVSALKKIETQNHHWINDVLHSHRRSTTPSLLRSHPSTQERVRCLLGLDMLSGFATSK